MVCSFRSFLLAGAMLLAVPGGSVQAAEIGPDGARAAEGAIREWLSGLLGPSMPVASSPLHLTPAGDHYDLSITLPLQDQLKNTPLQVVGQAMPLDGGKWSFQGVRIVLPLRTTLTLPVKDTDDPKEAPTLQPVTFDINADEQGTTGVIDPSLQTPWTWTQSFKRLTSHAENPHLRQEMAIEAFNSVSNIKPAGNERLDVSTDGTMQGYKLVTHSAAAGDLNVSVGLVRVEAALTGLSRARGASLAQAMTSLAVAGLAQQGSASTPKPPKIGPEVVRNMLAALQDLASDMTINETFQDMSVSAPGAQVQVGRASLGLGGRSESGLLRAYMAIGMEDLALPGLPLGDMAALVPKRVALRPFVGNVAVADLLKLANDSGDGKKVPQADIAALFSHGGIATGLESMRVELGGALFTGTANVTVTDPEHANGTGQVVAEGFDGLMAQMSTMPALAQGMAVAAFVKGIGREQNGRLTWDISYTNNKLVVNGVDLTAMAGGPAQTAPTPSPGGAPKGLPGRPQNRPRQ